MEVIPEKFLYTRARSRYNERKKQHGGSHESFGH